MTIIGKMVKGEEPGDRNFMTVHMQQYPFIFSDEKKYRIQRHLAFWGFWWIFQAFLYSFVAITRPNQYLIRFPVALMESFIFLFAHIFLAYSLMYFLIPKFLLKQRYRETVIWTIILFLLTALLSTLLGRFVIDPLRASIVGEEYIWAVRPYNVSIHLSLLAGLRGAITIGGIAAAIKLMKYWYMKEQRNLQLQKQNVEAQLQLLKAQVHPHFLFNTLNNIYSYTQNTSPVASRLVTGLSDMLRFILYECNQPLVPLSKELKMIQDYVNLEKVRYGNKLDLHLDFPENSNNLSIAPLLLLPFVENSFKHGASHMLEQPWISMHVTIDGQQMQMKLINGKNPEAKQENARLGIGIQNVKKRLELIYPNKHELSITHDQDVFIVSLKLELEQKEPLSKISVIQELNHA